MEFLGDRRAAEDRTPLEKGHRQPGPGEVGRAGQAVVARADDGHIENLIL